MSMTNDNPLSRVDAPRQLPSGRSVIVSAEAGREAIEIRSANGEMEIRIALTDQGPVLQLRGARLQIDSTDTVAVNCRDFEINASNGIKLASGGDIDIVNAGETRMKTQGSTWIDADFVNLNCLDRKGYHDFEAEGAKALPEGTPAAGDRGGGHEEEGA